MDFTRTAAADTVADMVGGLLERGFDPDKLWSAMAEAGLLALTVPESLGGDGLGIEEVAAVLTELARRASVGPALATLGFGILPLTILASPQVQVHALAGLETGPIITAALMEPASALPAHPATSAVGDDFRVTGVKVAVPYAEQSRAILVPTDIGIVLVPSHTAGVRITASPSSGRDPEYTVEFTDAPGELITTQTAEFYRIALACISAVADGLAAGAAELTASHLANRQQFGKPLATFQAVAGEIADVYVTARTMHVAASAAIWEVLSENVTGDVDVAAYWIAAELPAAMQMCHHLHGGIGVDVTYPMHRYYSAAKDLARLVGGESYRLEQVGAQCS